MELNRILKELLLLVSFSIFFLLFTTFISFVILTLVIQDCLIFIGKRVGDKTNFNKTSKTIKRSNKVSKTNRN